MYKRQIEQLRPRLRIARKKHTRPLIDLSLIHICWDDVADLNYDNTAMRAAMQEAMLYLSLIHI